MNSVIRVSVVTLYNQLWDKQPCLLVSERQKAVPRYRMPGWCLGFVFPHYRSQIMNIVWQVCCRHSMYICCLVNSWPSYMQNLPFKPEKLPQRLQTLFTGHEKKSHWSQWNLLSIYRKIMDSQDRTGPSMTPLQNSHFSDTWSTYL